jgi:hypothetical protein
MITPIYWSCAFDPCLCQPLARDVEVATIYPESVVAFAQWTSDPFVPLCRGEGRTFYLKQREILRPTLKQRLIAQVRDDNQPQHFGIKPFGRCKFVDFDSKMVELFKFHQTNRILSLQIETAQMPFITRSSPNLHYQAS